MTYKIWFVSDILSRKKLKSTLTAFQCDVAWAKLSTSTDQWHDLKWQHGYMVGYCDFVEPFTIYPNYPLGAVI